MLVAQKWRVHRDVVFDRLRDYCGVDLTNGPTLNEIAAAITTLERLRFNWRDET